MSGLPPRPQPGVQAAAALAGSTCSANFPALLRELGGSLLVSTYQAGKLVVLRPDGAEIAAHAYPFDRPMGMAADARRLVLGTRLEITEFHKPPAAARIPAHTGVHDAVYLARRGHITGHIDIHEMAWDAQGELWFVNTLFSCLCTLDDRSSFVPRWRPAWVSHYAAEDRCHLNGVGLRDGAVRYATALGETNTREGWRANRRDGGVLIDVPAQAVIARGLAMPHSPRWYDGRLWLLESSRGALCTLDPDSGRREDVARLPGFCRGIDFLGPIAFVGLSQQRSTAAFADLPDAGETPGLSAGVWAVDIRSGAILGHFRFAAEVQEVFAVQALPGVLSPQIVQDGELLELACPLRPTD